MDAVESRQINDCLEWLSSVVLGSFSNMDIDKWEWMCEDPEQRNIIFGFIRDATSRRLFFFIAHNLEAGFVLLRAVPINVPYLPRLSFR